MEILTSDFIFLFIIISIILLVITFLRTLIIIKKIYTIINLLIEKNKETKYNLNSNQIQNNTNIRKSIDILSEILKKVEKLSEEFDSIVKQLGSLNKSRINNHTNVDSNSVEESEIIYLLYKDNKLIETDEEQYYMLKKTKEGRFFLYISDNILKKTPTPEFDTIIQRFYNVDKLPNPKRYKLVQPTELKYHNEFSGDYEIKQKGTITYD